LQRRFIQNLYRDGTRLQYFKTICKIARQWGGSCATQRLVSGLLLEAKVLNKFVKSGRIGSETTANDYVENTIAFGLGKRVKNEFQLRPLGKALSCFKNNPKISLTPEEKTILLTSYLRNDLDGLISLVGFLEGKHSVSILDIAEKHWSEIFQGTPLLSLTGAARLHRIIPRLEWYADLDIVKKADGKYSLSSRAGALVRHGREMTSLDLSLKYYFPERSLKTTGVEEFRRLLEDVYVKALAGFSNTFEVEIDTLRSLVVAEAMRRQSELTSTEFDRMLLDYWRCNLERVRLSGSSIARGHEEEGLIHGARLYSYISVHTSS